MRMNGWVAAAGMAWATLCASNLSAAAPPASGTISVESKSGDDAPASSTTLFASALGGAFEGRGFVVLEQPGHAAYVVEFSLARAEVGTGMAKVPNDRSNVIPGGAPNAVGVGVVIPFSTGKSTPVPLQRTSLEVRMRKRDDPTIIWQGTAITVRAAGTRKGQDATVAADLSAALLRAYPAQPEGVIGVP